VATASPASARIPLVAVSEPAMLEARVERAVRAAVAERRAELEELVEARVDLELRALADELVAARLATNGAARDGSVVTLCARCGSEPALHHRTLCLACLRARRRELGAGRRARRQASASTGDGEEPAPARANGTVRRPRGLVRRPERRWEPAAKVDGGSGPEQAVEAIAADELARRVRRGRGVKAPGLSAGELEAWLVDGELARVDGGLLVPTARCLELGGGISA
jgi:hypothetical protein